jgi:short-subunit dehydrogenase
MKALVTGASSGIGRDMAIYLGELGYDVILVSRDENRLKETASKIKTKTTIYPCDLTGRDNCFKLYDHFKDEDIDLLVNGAGFGLFGNTWETDINKEMKMIDVNVNALHILSKLFLADMVKKDKGRILNIASSAGFFAGPYLNTYYATKNYVLKWTEAIYEELRRVKSKVHVSCLCPGPVDTNFNKVAGGSFGVKALSSEYVAKYGIDKCLKNKLVIIPGFGMKCGIFFSRFLPTKLSLKMVYNIQKKKVK